MTYDEVLARMLDPEGLYWSYPGDEVDDPNRVREIEIRLDVPKKNSLIAISTMKEFGWSLNEAPDTDQDQLHRLYFRRKQSLAKNERTAMLVEALKTAFESDGQVRTWIEVEELND